MPAIRIASGLVVPLAVAVLVAAPAGARRATTCPHAGTINGASVLIDCGSAKGRMRFGSLRVSLKNGICQRSSANFSLGFGAVLAGPSAKKPPDSFQLIAGGSGSAAATHDGSYRATLQLMRSGAGYIGDTVKLTLTHRLGAGTFAGTLTSTTSDKKVTVGGSFTC